MLSKRKERNATPNRQRGADGWRGRERREKGKKKARYESGLNLSLEENRGDRKHNAASQNKNPI
jgi:hypothetical protein